MSSSSESDEDFMDLSKPLKQVVLPPVGRHAKEMDLLRRQNLQKWPPNLKDEEEPQYFVEIQKREREKMAQNQAFTEENSVHFPSAMSQFETDTIGNSSVHNASVISNRRPPPDNLR